LAPRKAAELGVPVPTAPAPPAPAPSVVAAPPSFEDIRALYELCGGRALEVVLTLAKCWGERPEDIAPTVCSWLVDMPPILPPSRSRSAPPVLPPAMKARLSSARPQRTSAHARSSIWSRSATSGPVAVTAPVRAGTGRRLDSALAGLHAANTRLNGAASRSMFEDGDRRRAAPPRTQVYSLHHEPAFVPVVLTAAQVEAVPEEAPVEQWGEPSAEDPALTAFMQRSLAMQGKLKATVRSEGGKRESHMRF
jgi:hypothetical protein